MRISIIICGYLLLNSVCAWASHIAGGGIELIHIDKNLYNVNLIVYFDEINGNPRSKDEYVGVSFFSKRTNTLIFTRYLVLYSEEDVKYTKPECSNGEIITNKLVYSGGIVLDPSIFNDTEGYYIAWQRCCRNYAISNIFSDNPDITGSIAAGNTFYLEFPAVVKNGDPFVNSSPIVQSILSDYACPLKPYYVRLTAQDNDGDSLVYSLTTPYNTHEAVALPDIKSGPYPTITWRQGYSLENVMGGASNFKVSNKGLVTVNPEFQGLYVFALKIEEYRNKELIGTSIRDYQILVVDQCDNSVPPKITGPTSVTIPHTYTGDDRCITVTVSDPDSQTPASNFMEFITIRAIGSDFTGAGLAGILPTNTTAVLENGATKDFSICFPTCPPTGTNPYQVKIIVEDDACSQPFSDTLGIMVNAPVPPNTLPYFTEPPTVVNPNVINVEEGNSVTIKFAAQDDDGDTLNVSVEAENFVLSDVGMDVSWSELASGSVSGQLSWDALCSMYDFSERTSFRVKIEVEDIIKCKTESAPYLIYDLNIIILENTSPIIDTDLTPAPDEHVVTGMQTHIFESVSFNVTGEDYTDNDFLVLEFLGSDALGITRGSNLEDFGINFTGAEGTTAVQSTFNIDLQCYHMQPEQETNIIDLQFVVVDDGNKCNIYRSDTVWVELEVLPPNNTAPDIKISSLNPNISLDENNNIDMTIGEQIALGIHGFDVDQQDSVYISLIFDHKTPIPTGYKFQPARGKSPISTTFAWNPDCSIFQDNVYEKDYTLQFRIEDNTCFNVKSKIIPVQIHIRDIITNDVNFEPINFFSPNGDGENDYYSMIRRNVDTGDLENFFPEDNCDSQFENILIYNRWGVQVFESKDRNFKWLWKGEKAGVYYYSIKYSKRTYKGPLSIRY